MNERTLSLLARMDFRQEYLGFLTKAGSATMFEHEYRVKTMIAYDFYAAPGFGTSHKSIMMFWSVDRMIKVVPLLY